MREREVIVADLRACARRLAEERDRLRELLDEVEGLHDAAQEASEYLDLAADRLSELV